MWGGPGFYSRLVGILKIGLPLLAFGILLAMFLISPEDELEGGLTFTEADLAALGDGLQIRNPQLSGQSPDGAVYLFEADVVRPNDASLRTATVERLSGEVQFPDARRFELTAPSAAFDMGAQTLSMEDGIDLRSSDGYHVVADSMNADLTGAIFSGEGNVRATGPAGEITSDRVRLSAKGGDGEKPVIWFESRVKVRAEPAAGTD